MNKFGKCITFDLTFTLIKVNGSVGIQYARILKKSVKNYKRFLKKANLRMKILRFDYNIEAESASKLFRKHYKNFNKIYPVYGYYNG